MGRGPPFYRLDLGDGLNRWVSFSSPVWEGSGFSVGEGYRIIFHLKIRLQCLDFSLILRLTGSKIRRCFFAREVSFLM